jgi:hypothetical protein
MNRGDAVEHQRDELGLDFGRPGRLRPDLKVMRMIRRGHCLNRPL